MNNFEPVYYVIYAVLQAILVCRYFLIDDYYSNKEDVASGMVIASAIFAPIVTLGLIIAGLNWLIVFLVVRK